MPSTESPFSPEYSKGSYATERSNVEQMPARKDEIPAQTETSQTVAATSGGKVEFERYGIGKPRRVVIRGKIARA